eukprot:COSAG02_NODE_137_length_34526_cov_94.448079_18_plen_146_part_00
MLLQLHWTYPIFYTDRFSGDLKNGTGYPTFDAYNSTSPAVWGQSDSHFCCSQWKVGCQTVANHGVRPITITAQLRLASCRASSSTSALHRAVTSYLNLTIVSNQPLFVRDSILWSPTVGATLLLLKYMVGPGVTRLRWLDFSRWQ